MASEDVYRARYHESITDPDAFWAAEARNRIHWFKPFTRVRNV
ncbi:MAG: hypothetical protein F4183_05990, partial [Rhodothermaceae bacterium]|nr:hypothetical protein [Rhodothermaceae bacterium]